MADNENANVSAGTVKGSEIFDRELLELSHRREEADRPEQDQNEGEIRKNLVGLAFSGGSLRSAAISLGFLQAIYKRGWLPFVDYLSTVSGGGYAGAYLSSASLATTRQRREQEGAESQENDSRTAAGEDEQFPIALLPSGRQPPRMMRFINGARRMNDSLSFFNRYMMGLILSWICIFSGLLAAASFITWAFRWLDLPRIRDWLYALGFDGDVKLAFFCSFVLFVVWIMCWGISYFKYGGRATGTVTRLLFLILVLMTMVAVASLFGAGELDDIGQVFAEFGVRIDPETMKQWQTIIQTVLFSVIGASLLPYLRPKRLLKSGMDAKGSFEKMTFWIATRALVFGVPFLFISFFARENISQWNDHRDDRVTRNELSGFHAWSPLARQLKVGVKYPDGKPRKSILEGESQQAADKFPANKPQLGDIWSKEHAEGWKKAWVAFHRYLIAQRQVTAAALYPDAKPPLSDDVPYPARYRPDELDEALAEYGMPNPRWPTKEDTLSFPVRWYHFFEYILSRAVGSKSTDNPVFVMATEKHKERNENERFVAELNLRLEDPNFYKTLLPEDAIDWDVTMEDAEPDKTAADAQEHQSWFWSLFRPFARQARDVGKGRQPLAKEIDNEQEFSEAFELVKANHPGRSAEDWAKELQALRKQASTLLGQIEFPATNKRADDILNEQQRRQVLAMNRNLLAAYYGNLIGDKSTVYATNVLLADQSTRMKWFLWSLLTFVVSGLLVDANATSWHGYYARSIARMWIEKVRGFGRQIPLAQLDTCEAGRPYHLINGTATFFGRRERPDQSTPRELFLFSKLYCGSDRTGYQPTEQYMHGKYMLDDAIAVSGGAVSPLFTTNPLVHCLLLLFNIRMGQWVLNPATRRNLPARISNLISRWPVTPLRVLATLLLPAERRPFCFVTDGGHYENLGLAPLIRRRCRLMFVLDGSHDPHYRFAELFQVARWAQAKFGINLYLLEDGEQKQLTVQSLVPKGLAESKETEPDTKPVSLMGDDRYSQANYLLLKVEYPPQEGRIDTGYIVYMKSAITGDEPFELLHYCQRNPEFPHDSSANQFFDEDLFESYRHLGFFMGESICKGLPADVREKLKTLNTESFIDALVGKRRSEGKGKLDPAVARLIEQLNHGESAAEREHAASQLGKIDSSDDRIVSALIDGLTDSDEFVAKICDLQLREFGKNTLDQLRELGLHHVSDKTQAAVAAVIGELLPDLSAIDLKTVEVLRTQLSHKRARVRNAARAALQVYCVTFQDHHDHHEMIASIRAELSGGADPEVVSKGGDG